jgi:quinol monooxygenase YgiN
LSTVTVTLRIFPGKKKEFLQTVNALHEDMKRGKGFTKSTVFQEVNDPDVFHLTEEWDTQDDLEIFAKSEAFRVLMGALKVLSKETEIHYHISAAEKKMKVL